MYKFLLVIVALTAFQFHSIAQDYRDLDSLQIELKSYTNSKFELDNNAVTQRDTTQVRILFELSKVYWYNDFNKGIDYAQQCINLAKRINYKRGIVDGNYCLVVIYLNKGEDSLTTEYINRTLELAEEINYKARIADAYVQSGFVNYLQGNTLKSQEDCLKGLKLAEALNYKECLANAYCNLGNINNLLGNQASEFKYYSTALKIAKEIDCKVQIAGNCHNLSMTYVLKGDNTTALSLLNEALKVNREIGNRLWEAYNQDVIGVIHLNMEDYKTALTYSLNSAKILKELGEKVKLCTTLNNVGWMYISAGDYTKARINLNESVKVGLESKYFDGLWGTYESLVTLDSLEGNWRLAYQHHVLFTAFRDSVNNKDNIKKTVEAGLKFEFDKKQLSDSLKFLQEKSIGDIKLKEQKAYAFGGLFVILVIGILLFFVYRNFKEQKEANRLLKEAQEQLIRNEKLAAFGIMASRVAHEIQNPLNFVNNFSDISKDLVEELVVSNDEQEKMEISKTLIDNLQRINEHGKKAADIVKQLQEHTLKGTAHEFFETKN